MDIQKGRKHLSKSQIDHVIDLERRQTQSKKNDRVRFTKRDEAILKDYYKMINFLGEING